MERTLQLRSSIQNDRGNFSFFCGSGSIPFGTEWRHGYSRSPFKMLHGWDTCEQPPVLVASSQHVPLVMASTMTKATPDNEDGRSPTRTRPSFGFSQMDSTLISSGVTESTTAHWMHSVFHVLKQFEPGFSHVPHG